MRKAIDRFYPDFICKLADVSILVIEPRSADRWENAEDDRLIGELWAKLSEDRCRFVMTKNREGTPIEAKIKQALNADSG